MTMARSIAAAVLLAAMTAGGVAQTWPSKQIEMIITFPAGSGVDVIGRAMAAAIAQQAKQNVVVLNRDGAAGTLGFATLAAAAPDGHTISFGPTTPVANAPYLVKGVRYNVDSFTYVCQVFENVFTVAVGPQSKLTSAQELFAAARQNPGKLTYGHAGLGTIPHLSMENLAEALGYKFAAVPFRGDAPLIPALLRGEIDFASTAVSTIRPSRRSGRSRSSRTGATRPIRTFRPSRSSASRPGYRLGITACLRRADCPPKSATRSKTHAARSSSRTPS
jgi:tripartite-type tricarboxylate transporter receptor subunit TctC